MKKLLTTSLAALMVAAATLAPVAAEHRSGIMDIGSDRSGRTLEVEYNPVLGREVYKPGKVVTNLEHPNHYNADAVVATLAFIYDFSAYDSLLK